jgi:Rps23 Pro-64 3,4-dihydroxylase Tpa1-like proline 4-hydroxylase
MLSPFLSKSYLDEHTIRALHAQLSQAKPFPHLVLKSFFVRSYAEHLLQALSKATFVHQESDLYSFSQTEDFGSIQQPELHSLHRLLCSSPFQDFLLRLTGLPVGKKVDCSGFAYQSGDYLLPHDDRADTRKLAYTYHLTKDFPKKDGGALEFFDGKKIAVSLPPTFNTLIVFLVEEGKSIHQVSEVTGDGERFALSGWFHDR